jgi:hypothetical protein
MLLSYGIELVVDGNELVFVSYRGATQSGSFLFSFR